MVKIFRIYSEVLGLRQTSCFHKGNFLQLKAWNKLKLANGQELNKQLEANFTPFWSHRTHTTHVSLHVNVLSWGPFPLSTVWWTFPVKLFPITERNLVWKAAHPWFCYLSSPFFSKMLHFLEATISCRKTF